MGRYHNERLMLPLRDSGSVEFAAEAFGADVQLRETIREVAKTEHLQPSGFRYDDERQLLRLISSLQHRLGHQEAASIYCRVSYDEGTGNVQAEDGDAQEQGWFPLSRLFGKVGAENVADYILHRHFATFLQPIVGVNREIVGYECLLRPLPEQPPFRPAELFAAARGVWQHAFLDREARQAAIRLSTAHLPQGVKKFVNFLPSSVYCPDSCLQGTFDAIQETGADPGDFVFEVVETEQLDHPDLPLIFDRYRRKGVRLAMDDVGDGYATPEVMERLQPDYVKMDRKWVSGCDGDSTKQRHISGLLERAARFHGVVLAEGVEREAEWNYLKKAGIPLFQGYLFGKAMPVPATAKASR